MENNDFERKLGELESRIRKLEEVECGICERKVLGGIELSDDGSEETINPVCADCFDDDE